MPRQDKYATLIIDMQNDYVADGGVLARAGMKHDTAKGIVPRVNELVEFSRSQGLPIIWVKMVWDSDAEVGLLAERSPFLRKEGLRRNTWGAEIVDGLEVRPEDLVVEKQRFNAFYSTRLEIVLRNLEVTSLLVGGVRTDFCVDSTVREAFFRDYRVIVIKDCVAGYFPDLHENALKTMGAVFAQVRTLEEIQQVFARKAVSAER